MSYAAEPYVQFVDDLLTALTGGVVRDEFQMLPETQPFRLRPPGPVIPATVRIFGQADGAYRRFQTGKDYRFESDFTITWLPNTAGSVLPDTGTSFYVNYEYTHAAGANPPLTDRNPGSVTRLLAESFGREYAVLSRQLEAIYKAGFVETATGRDLDQIGLLVGVERRTATFAVGSAVFSRATPAPGDITISAGTRLSTAAPPVTAFEARAETTLRRGALSVDIPIQALASGPSGVVAAGTIQVMNRPIVGIDSVNNPQATGFQSSAETDDQLRGRIRRAHQGAGLATPGALLAALTTIPGLREKDVQILEDPISRPGVIELNVALPQLPAGQEAQLLKQFSDQAVELIEKARPVGVRIVHNIDAPTPSGPGEAGPGLNTAEGDAPVAAGIPPAGSQSLIIDVNAWLTPATRGLTKSEQDEMIRTGEKAIRAFVAEAGIGETLVYNRLVGHLISLNGVLDVAVEMYPQAAPTQPRRKNILPLNPSLRPVAGKVDVQLRGSLIILDVVMSILAKDAGLLVDPLQLSVTVSAEATAALNQSFLTTPPAVLNKAALQGMLGTPQTFEIEKLDYSVEFQDVGVRIFKQNPSIQPSPSDQFWVRRVTVEAP